MGSSPRRQASINSSHSADMAVDITKDNFQAMLPVIKEALDKCKHMRQLLSLQVLNIIQLMYVLMREGAFSMQAPFMLLTVK